MDHAVALVESYLRIKGYAELNAAARNPAVLRTVLARFGCCRPEDVTQVVDTLLRHGRAQTRCGHQVRMIAFGSLPPLETTTYTTISLGHVHEFLETYVREHWNILKTAQFKDPAFGFEVMLEKARRGWQQGTPKN